MFFIICEKSIHKKTTSHNRHIDTIEVCNWLIIHAIFLFTNSTIILAFEDKTQIQLRFSDGEDILGGPRRWNHFSCQHGTWQYGGDRRVRRASICPQRCGRHGVPLVRGSRGVSYLPLCSGICRRGGGRSALLLGGARISL